MAATPKTSKAAPATTSAKAEKTEAEKEEAKELTYANGLRAAREAKGYGRIAIAEALDITTSAWYKLEVSAEGKELKDTLAAIKALPEAPKAERKAATPKAKTETKAKAAASAKPKAKPAAASDLI